MIILEKCRKGGGITIIGKTLGWTDPRKAVKKSGQDDRLHDEPHVACILPELPDELVELTANIMREHSAEFNWDEALAVSWLLLVDLGTSPFLTSLRTQCIQWLNRKSSYRHPLSPAQCDVLLDNYTRWEKRFLNLRRLGILKSKKCVRV